MEKPEKCINRTCDGFMERQPEKEKGRIKKLLVCVKCARTKTVLSPIGGETPRWAAPRGMEVSYE